MLQAEVPLHYLLNFRHGRFVDVVELGVWDARQWCRQEQIARMGDRGK
jgi:hypothetical protein